MKRKVGDRVTIKSLDWWEAQPKDENGDITKDSFHSFTEDMSKFCGKEAVIEKVLVDRFYHISINNGRFLSWNWEDWMFEDSDEKFDYFEFTKENLRELVWNGKGKVVDQDGQIIYLNFPAEQQEISMRTNFLFETKFPLEIRVPKEKKEVVSIHQFKPFEKVLVRNEFGEKWQCNLFSHSLPMKVGEHKMGTIHCCVWANWKQCIPYEGNENLVGRTENPPYYGK